MSRKKNIIVFSIFFISCVSDSERIYLKNLVGSKVYQEKNYSKAQGYFEEALALDQENSVIYYNNAHSLYQSNEYLKAQEKYQKAGGSSQALKNLGNTQKRLGDGEKDQSKKIQFYENALNTYKQAIVLNEADLKLKFNYEYLVKVLEDLKKQQQNNSSQSQSQSNSSEKSQSEQSSSSQSQSSSNQSSQSDQSNSSKSQNSNKSSEEGKNQSGQSSSGSSAQGQNPKEDKAKTIKEKEAMMILKSLEKKEKEDLKNNRKVKVRKWDPNEKDW